MTLAVGATGAAVVRVKTRLRALHFAVDAGSTMTARTRDAVMAFQKLNGLQRDGVVGAQTLRAMNKPRAVQAGAGPAARIVVDLSDQVLLIVRHGKVVQIVNACTGNPNLPDGRGEATPVGSYRVTRKIRGPHEAELGVLYSPSYFHGGIAVHGAASVLATPASHGCVRIPMYLAQSVQDAMRMGMTVQVRR